MNEDLKQALWSRWGDSRHPAEWDGRIYGGGRGSQRFWEYLWTAERLPAGRRGLDIGAGSTLFWPDLLAAASRDVWALDPAIPFQRRSDRYRAETLEQFLTKSGGAVPAIDWATCVSVLEHVPDKPGFCRALDALDAPIVLTAELAFEADLVRMPMLYECLAQFERHYVSHMETCPVWADNSMYGQWRPIGVVLALCSARVGCAQSVPVAGAAVERAGFATAGGRWDGK